MRFLNVFKVMVKIYDAIYEIWTLKKAASVIGISTQTLSKMLLRGEIVAVKPGRKWKLTKHNVTNYMNRNRN